MVVLKVYDVVLAHLHVHAEGVVPLPGPEIGVFGV